MKPNGFVLAASITSHTLILSALHMRAISFTSPMLTLRNVFSSSFTISATCVDETGTTVSTDGLVEPLRHLRCSVAVTPPTTFGMLRVLKLVVPRIDALGREREREVPPDLEPGRLERRPHDLLGGARIGRALEDDELARDAGTVLISLTAETT